MTVNSDTVSYLFDRTLTSIAFDFMRRYTPVYPLLVDTRPSDGPYEKEGGFGGLGLFEEHNEEQDATEDSPAQQHKVTFVHGEFKKKTRVSRRVYDDEDWGYVRNLAMGYGRAGAQTFDANIATLFNGGFTTTMIPSGSGQTALFSNTINNIDSTYSYDNLITNAFGVEGVRQMQQNIRDQTDYVGQPTEDSLDTILLPTDLEEAGLEVVRSDMRPDNANMARNVYFGVVQAIIWNRLTSATAWMGWDSDALMRNSVQYIRVPPEFYGDGNVETGHRIFGGYFRKSNGFVDGRGMCGSTGAT